jgi:hypothetical protein
MPVIVAATTTDVEKVPTGVLGLFKEEIALEASEYSRRTGWSSLLAESRSTREVR